MAREDNPEEVPSQLAYEPGPRVEQLVANLDQLAKGRSGYSAPVGVRGSPLDGGDQFLGVDHTLSGQPLIRMWPLTRAGEEMICREGAIGARVLTAPWKRT